MDLPNTYFWKLAHEPLLVYKGRIYLLKSTDEAAKDADFVSFKKKKYELHESETLANLELLYHLDNPSQIDQYKTDFLNTKFENVLKQRLVSIKEAKRVIANSPAAKTVIEKILPALEGKQFVDNALKANEKVDAKESREFNNELVDKEEQIVEEFKRKANIKKEIISERLALNGCRNTDDSILGTYIFHNFNVLIPRKNEFYVLEQKSGAENFLEINKKTFALTKYNEYSSVDAVEQLYLAALRLELNVQAIKEGRELFKKLQKYQKQQKILQNLCIGEEYVGKNCSFQRTDENQYTFYIHFPKFVNKFPTTGVYHLFPAGRIMLRAVYKPAKQDFEISRGTIYVDDIYKHPFTNPHATKSELCMGPGFKYPPSKVPGYEAIPQVLLTAKTILMSGYNAKHQHLRNVYMHNYFNQISYASAKRQGIPITNINVMEGSKQQNE